MHIKALRGPAQPQFGRRQLFFHAWIEAYRTLRISCFVRDLTPEGARIVVKTALPARFRLFVEAKGFKANCEIIDEGQGYVDVRFL